MESKKSSVWMERAKSFAVLLGIVLGIYQLYQFLPGSDPLRADVEFGPFILPPSLARLFDQNRKTISSEHLLKLLANDWSVAGEGENNQTGQVIEQATARLSLELRDQIPTSVPAEIDLLRGIYKVVIKNRGSATLSDVRLNVPLATLCQVSRIGQEPTFNKIKEVMTVGQLAPQESATVTLWSTFLVDEHWANQISLTHSNGVGTIAVRIPTGRLGQFAEAYWVLIFPILFFSVLMVFILSDEFTISRRSGSR